MGLLDQVKKSWNAFRSNDQSYSKDLYEQGPPSYGTAPPQNQRLRYFNERSIITSIYTRIAIDVADILIRHAKVDEDGNFLDNLTSEFNTCLTLQPNLDQAPRAFRQDIVMTLFDEGIATIVPVDTISDPQFNAQFDILSMRVGKITQWYPKHVRVSVYNEAKGVREEITLEKQMVAIVENPFYAVMNEPNSTLQRLTRKLQLLDTVDEASSSGKLDLIIQLPYVIKSEARQKQAEQRREQIEFQLKGSQYGIAYTDGTEKITQLNRPAENNLLKQIEYLTNKLYGELGITEEVMNGTANEAAMLLYYNRTIEPILDAIVEAMQRAFLGLIGTKKKQKVLYFREPFKFVPLGQLADIVDTMSRNEILSPNEIRSAMGYRPSKDPKSDELINSNMPPPAPPPQVPPNPQGESENQVETATNDELEAIK